MPSADQYLSTRTVRHTFEKQVKNSSDFFFVAPWKLWIERLADMDADLAVPLVKTHPPNGFDHGATHKWSLPKVLVASSAECAAQQAHQAFINRAPFRLANLRLRIRLVLDASSETTWAAIWGHSAAS